MLLGGHEADEDEAAGPSLVLRLSDFVPPVVSEVFEAHGYREHEEEEDGERWDVWWRAGRFTPSEYAAANPMQRLNHFPKTTGLTKKDSLLRNLRRMRATHRAQKHRHSHHTRSRLRMAYVCLHAASEQRGRL